MIDNKTVDQIKQVASSGNIVAGYGAKFPWGAASTCRFHGTDGIVLGNGTIIRNYGTVKMIIDAKGSVKFAGKTSDGFMVSGSTFLMLDDDWYHVMADMAFYDKKSGNVYNITPCWQPIFNQQGDIVNWDEKCCDHSLRIYPFE